MSRWQVGTLTMGLLGLGLAGAACEPAPQYDAPQPPYVGLTEAEGSIVATGGGQRLNILSEGFVGGDGVTLTLPAGAYPAGTRVTLRWVSALALAGTDVDQLGQVQPRAAYFGDVAAQVLPPTPPPASPLTLELPVIAPGTYDVLHANECDAAWQITGTAQGVALGPGSASASFEISVPGLWALGQKADGGQPPADQRPEAGCQGFSDGDGGGQ